MGYQTLLIAILILLDIFKVSAIKLLFDPENSICKYHFCDIRLCCSLNKNCENLGNGECDNEFNKKECLWDAGDCLPCHENCYLSDKKPSYCDDSCYPKDYSNLSYQETNKISSNAIIDQHRKLTSVPVSSESISSSSNVYTPDFSYFDGILTPSGESLNYVYFVFEGTFTSNNLDLSNLIYPFNISLDHKSNFQMTNTSLTNTTSFSLRIDPKNGGNDCKISVTINQKYNPVTLSAINCTNITISIFSSDGVPLVFSSVNTSFILSSMSMSNINYSGYDLITLQDSQVFSNISNLTLTNTEFKNSRIFNINYSKLYVNKLQTVDFSFSETVGLINVSNQSEFHIINANLNKSIEDTSILFSFTSSYIWISDSIFSIDSPNDAILLNLTELSIFNSTLSCNFLKLKEKMNSATFYLAFGMLNFPNCPGNNTFRDQVDVTCNLNNCKKYNQYCDKGYFKLDGICHQCTDNTFAYHENTKYGLIDNPSCFDCSDNMTCAMGYIYPKPGVWRYSDQLEFPLVFRECPLQAACINDYAIIGKQDQDQFHDSQVNPFSWRTICREGYFGKFCHDCKDGFTKTSLNVCSKCPDLQENILIIIGVGIMFIIVSYYLIKTTVDAAFELDELYSIGLRIFINYFQIIYLCFQYKIQWPSEIQEIAFFKKSDPTKESPSPYYFFSFKCLLNNHFNEQDMFFVRTYFMMFLPILLWIISCLIIFILKWAKKNNRYVDSYKTIILIIPFLLVYPSVVTYSFSPLACISLLDEAPGNFNEHGFGELVNKKYLVDNRNIECNGEYFNRVVWCTVAGILLWAIGVPMYIFTQIFKQRKNLYGYTIKYKYGFLFNGYHHDRFYWEFVILFKKFIIVLLTVFMESNFQQNLQSILIITFLISFLILQIYFKPYIGDELNRMEIFASITAIVTVLLGVSYISSNETNGKSLAIPILIILVNFFFIIYWLKFMTKEVVSYIIRSFEFLRQRYYRRDPFEEDSVKENKFDALYIKDNEKIYTQIPHEESNKLRFDNMQSSKDLYGKIIETTIDDYKNNVGPSVGKIERQSTVIPQGRNRRLSTILQLR